MKALYIYIERDIDKYNSGVRVRNAGRRPGDLWRGLSRTKKKKKKKEQEKQCSFLKFNLIIYDIYLFLKLYIFIL